MTTPTTNATPPAKLTVRCQWCQTWNRVAAARVADRPKCGQCGKPMLLDRPLALTDETFARTIAESEIPVVVDLYADWCGPCKMMAPHVDEVARRHVGRVLVAKLDTDASPVTASGLNVRGIPTTIRYSGGQETGRRVGAMGLVELERFVAGTG